MATLRRYTLTSRLARLALAIALSLPLASGCAKHCKECHAEVMGVRTEPRILCGNQLKEAEKKPGITCE